MIATAIALTLLLPGKPAWLDTKVAGYIVAFDEMRVQTGVFDSQTGYYLVRSIDCDGAHITVLLTRDRRMIDNLGYAVHKPEQLGLRQGYLQPNAKKLGPLATGRGVRIGDTTMELVKRLGKPTSVERSGDRKQFSDYLYRWRDVRNGIGDVWTNRYTFKAGKLVEIQFTKDAVPGCGESGE